jgi:butyrate kinase
MTEPLCVLALNPGSTSTRIALFRDESLAEEVKLRHGPDDRAARGSDDSLQTRLGTIRRWLHEHEVPLASIDAVVGRGGLLRPLEGGVYRVNEALLRDARAGLQGRHPSNLGALLAHEIAAEAGAPAFVVDPVSVDEFDDLARLSGLAGIERRSLSHALSVHSAVRTLADELARPWREVRAVVAHLGGGVSVCPVRDGRIVDANNAVSEGPFSPQRTGGLPVQELLDLVYSGQYGEEEIRRMTVREGGLMSYLGTDDAVEVEHRIESGDEFAETVFRGLAYQVAKEIGAMATVLEGRLEAVVLTGGLARSDRLVDLIRERVEFLGPVRVLPLQEMVALARGALAALRSDEPIRDY